MISFNFKKIWIKFLWSSNNSGRIVLYIQLVTVAIVLFVIAVGELLYISSSHKIERQLSDILQQEDKVSALASRISEISSLKEKFLLDGRQTSSSARVMLSVLKDDLADLSGQFYDDSKSRDYLLPSEITKEFESARLIILRAERLAKQLLQQNRTLSYEDGVDFLKNYGVRDLSSVNKNLLSSNYELNLLAIQLERDLAQVSHDHHNSLALLILSASIFSIIISSFVYKRRIVAPLEQVSSVMKDFPETNIANNPKEGIPALEEVISKVHSSVSGSNEIQVLRGNFAKVLTKLVDTCFVLSEFSITDPLCSIGNRRAIELYGVRTWSQASRESCSIGLMMLDVDYFKSYNDHFGHEAGDVCLRNLAMCWSEILRRPLDEVYRYGGEEFLVLIYASTKEKFQKICEELRSATLSLAIEHPSSEFGSVTISGGCLFVSNASSLDFESACSIADSQLYRSKKAGRNRVSITFL